MYFAPHIDCGDNVIIVNADKVVLTANKAAQKFAYHHSGYPGGLRATSWQTLLEMCIRDRPGNTSSIRRGWARTATCRPRPVRRCV